jgi:hypothetical protein
VDGNVLMRRGGHVRGVGAPAHDLTSGSRRATRPARGGPLLISGPDSTRRTVNLRGASPPEQLDTAARVTTGIPPDGDLRSATAGRHMGAKEVL